MDVENILAENAALKRKLQSKTEALLILNQELIKCKTEKEFSKPHIDKKINGATNSHLYQFNAYRLSECFGCKQLDEFKSKNKILQSEVDKLEERLKDAIGDIQVLRKERRCSEGKEGGNWHGRESLVASLEQATARAKQLEGDVATLLDEKEALVSERDSYRCKVHRLNHQIAALLRAPQLDIDSLVMENKYLQERLDQCLADKEIVQQSLTKYKAMLEKRRNKGTVILGTSASCEGMVVTHKQVQDLLEGGKLMNNDATLSDLRALCLALLESLQDKSLALAHHKKTNKVLANRISELESIMAKNTERPLFPSRLLMDGYTSSNVDKEINNIILQDCDSNVPEEVESEKTENTENQNDTFSRDSDEILPPELQELVMKAIEDIKNDSSSIEV